MIRRTILPLILLALFSFGVLADDRFDKKMYIHARLDDLVEYCQILERLYPIPSTDSSVIATLERLIGKKTLIVHSPEFDVKDLDTNSIEGLLAVLRIAEHERFGNAWGQPLILDPIVEQITKIVPQLEAQQKHIRSKIIIY